MKIQKTNKSNQPKLYIVGTPIGNLSDITLRAIETLKMVDVIACEDTRYSQKLLNHLAIKKEKGCIFSCHQHNEQVASLKIVNLINSGTSVAYISDAGMPGVSDPGVTLINIAKENNIDVVVVPGASSLITALVGSGIDLTGFQFTGFLEAKKGQKEKQLSEILLQHFPNVLFESPHKIITTLELINKLQPMRQVVVVRELTKIFEEYLSGTSAEILAH